jgi:hypothetical protein
VPHVSSCQEYVPPALMGIFSHRPSTNALLPAPLAILPIPPFPFVSSVIVLVQIASLTLQFVYSVPRNTFSNQPMKLILSA